MKALLLPVVLLLSVIGFVNCQVSTEQGECVSDLFANENVSLVSLAPCLVPFTDGGVNVRARVS